MLQRGADSDAVHLPDQQAQTVRAAEHFGHRGKLPNKGDHHGECHVCVTCSRCKV